jgi:hypothetical protein
VDATLAERAARGKAARRGAAGRPRRLGAVAAASRRLWGWTLAKARARSGDAVAVASGPVEAETGLEDGRKERGMSTDVYEGRGSGWLEFSGILLLAVGFFRIISAIAYFADSRKLNDLTNGLFSSHTWAWGLWDLGIAAVAIMAGFSLFTNGGFGRVVAYIWAVLVIVQSFTIINLAPWYGALSIAVAGLVVYGLSTTPRGAD